jgi:hypothetical protein
VQSPLVGADWRDQLEATVREHVRQFIKEHVEAELSATQRAQAGARIPIGTVRTRRPVQSLSIPESLTDEASSRGPREARAQLSLVAGVALPI